MQSILENILLISGLSAVFIILFLLLKRLAWRKLAAWVSSAIWIMLLLRLMIPVQLNLPYVLFTVDSPDMTTVSSEAQKELERPVEIEQTEDQTTKSNSNTAQKSNANITTTVQALNTIQNTPIKKSQHINWFALLLYIYLAGVFIFFIRLVKQHIKLYKHIKTYSVNYNSELNEILQTERDRLGIRQKIKILVSDDIKTPSTTGFLKPKILLPTAMMMNMTNSQLRYVFLHELMHIKRGDILKLFLAEIATCIHWFNIVLHFVKPQIRQDIECACDARVLRIIGRDTYKEYGSVLFEISTNESKRRLGLISAYMAGRNKKRLKERLILIKNFNAKKLAFSSLIILVCLCLGLVACTSVFNKKDVYIDDETDDSPLKVYIMYWDNFGREVIDRYNWQVKAGLIEGREVEITEFKLEQYEEMYERIKNEILAGEGPDIVFIDESFCYSNDFVKMAEQNAFADLDILIDNSETFNYDDYNNMVMQASVIGGKRSFMPISYDVPYIFTTQEVLTNNGLQIPENISLESLYSVVTEYEQSNPLKWYGIADIIWEDVLNLNESTYSLDSNLLRKSIERLQHAYITNGNIYVSNEQAELFKAEELLYTNMLGKYGNRFLCFTGQYNQSKVYGNNAVFFNMPCDANGNTKARIDYGVSININSRHKNDAFKFVEYLMSYEVAFDVLNTSYSEISFPVNKQAYEYYKEDFLTNSTDVFDYENPLAEHIPEDLSVICIDIIENPTVCQFNGQAKYIYNNIIVDIILDYFKQKIDYDTMMQQVESKLELYLSE